MISAVYTDILPRIRARCGYQLIFVCKHWYKVLLLDQIEAIRARLPAMPDEDLIDLPAIFYNDLSVDQKIILPNILFIGESIERSLQMYGAYKYKCEWDQIIDSDYVMKMFMEKFPNGFGVYFRKMFISLIQYRYHINEKINFEQGGNDNGNSNDNGNDNGNDIKSLLKLSSGAWDKVCSSSEVAEMIKLEYWRAENNVLTQGYKYGWPH